MNQSKYYERKDEIGQLYKEYTQGEDVDKKHKRYKGVVKLKNVIRESSRNMKKLKKVMDRVRNIEDPVKRSKRLNELDRKYYKQITKFNKLYNKLRD